jgi:hypothetical protein
MLPTDPSIVAKIRWAEIVPPLHPHTASAPIVNDGRSYAEHLLWPNIFRSEIVISKVVRRVPHGAGF